MQVPLPYEMTMPGSEIEKRIKTLETAGGFLTSRTDRRTARLRVNRLLREIDGCIALMNK